MLLKKQNDLDFWLTELEEHQLTAALTPILFESTNSRREVEIATFLNCASSHILDTTRSKSMKNGHQGLLFLPVLLFRLYELLSLV